MPCIECGHEFKYELNEGTRRLDEVLTHYVEEHDLST
jgi:hypothetical protein